MNKKEYTSIVKTFMCGVIILSLAVLYRTLTQPDYEYGVFDYQTTSGIKGTANHCGENIFENKYCIVDNMNVSVETYIKVK